MNNQAGNQMSYTVYEKKRVFLSLYQVKHCGTMENVSTLWKRGFCLLHKVCPCSKTHSGDWTGEEESVGHNCIIYQSPGQCHHFKWQHPVVQLLTWPVSAVLLENAKGRMEWKKRVDSSRGLEFEGGRKQHWRHGLRKAIHCILMYVLQIRIYGYGHNYTSNSGLSVVQSRFTFSHGNLD